MDSFLHYLIGEFFPNQYLFIAWYFFMLAAFTLVVVIIPDHLWRATMKQKEEESNSIWFKHLV